MAEDKKIDAADLLKKAKALQATSGSNVLKENDSGGDTVVGKALNEIVTLNRTVKETKGFYTRMKEGWKKFCAFYSPVGAFLKKIARPYKWLWNKTSAKAYESKWARGLARLGRAYLLAWTVAALPFSSDTLGVEQARYITSEPVYDGTRMAVFGVQTDTLYLNSVTEVDHKNEIFTVKGCKDYGDCDDKNSVFFRVEPRLMHQMWKWFNKGNPFFIPGQEVAPITSGAAPFAYEVQSYGARWRFAKYFQAYPEILSVRRIEMPTSVATTFNGSSTGDQKTPVKNSVPATNTKPSTLPNHP
jgi:hypothetical protein